MLLDGRPDNDEYQLETVLSETEVEVEGMFRDVKLDIVFTRKFDGEKFSMIFSSPGLGTCAGVQTDEKKALDSAVRLLGQRLAEVIVEARKKKL